MASSERDARLGDIFVLLAVSLRLLIEQAAGVIAEQHGLAIDQAFLRLRGFARSDQARLDDVADRIVNRQLSI